MKTSPSPFTKLSAIQYLASSRMEESNKPKWGDESRLEFGAPVPGMVEGKTFQRKNEGRKNPMERMSIPYTDAISDLRAFGHV
jgi:hypothetical protein